MMKTCMCVCVCVPVGGPRRKSHQRAANKGYDKRRRPNLHLTPLRPPEANLISHLRRSEYTCSDARPHLHSSVGSLRV